MVVVATCLAMPAGGMELTPQNILVGILLIIGLYAVDTLTGGKK